MEAVPSVPIQPTAAIKMWVFVIFHTLLVIWWFTLLILHLFISRESEPEPELEIKTEHEPEHEPSHCTEDPEQNTFNYVDIDSIRNGATKSKPVEPNRCNKVMNTYVVLRIVN